MNKLYIGEKLLVFLTNGKLTNNKISKRPNGKPKDATGRSMVGGV